MDIFLCKIKNFALKKNNIIEISLLLCSIIVLSQNNSFSFNPFILILLCTSYLFSFHYIVLSGITLIGTSFFINLNYGLEISFIYAFYLVCFLFSLLIKNKTIKEIVPICFTNLFVFLLYLFTSKTVFLRLNAFISFIISLFFCLAFYYNYKQVKNKTITNKALLGISFGMLSILFIKVNSIQILWFVFLMLTLQKIDNTIYAFALPTSFILLYWLGNNPFSLLICILLSLLSSCLFEWTYKQLICIIIFTISFFTTNQQFYLTQEYYQFLGGALLVLLLPNHITDIIRNMIFNPIPIYSNQAILEEKMVDIDSFCKLLMDDRFEKYENLDIQLSEDIKKEICSQCIKKDHCLLKIEKYLSGSVSNSEKQEILDNCLYSYQLIRKINFVNKKILNYSESELPILENKKILNNTYDIIRQLINAPKTIIKNTDCQFISETLSFSKGANVENGDNFFIDSEKESCLQTILLSDGMGHSSKSKAISSYLINLVQYLIEATNSFQKTIQYANQILLAKTYEEIYATLDLCQIDLSNGKMKLFKAGSFTTVLIRNKKVFEYSTKLPPIGIVHNICISVDEIQLQNNDILLFMTDGYGEKSVDHIKKYIQKSSFLPFKSYIKFLNNKLTKEREVDDDTTIIGIKIQKI